MAWLSAVSADNTIVISEKRFVNRSVYSAETRTQTNTQTTTHYIGLTKAAADTQLATSIAKTGCMDAYIERVDDSGQYRVVEVLLTLGEWTAE